MQDIKNIGSSRYFRAPLPLVPVFWFGYRCFTLQSAEEVYHFCDALNTNDNGACSQLDKHYFGYLMDFRRNPNHPKMYDVSGVSILSVALNVGFVVLNIFFSFALFNSSLNQFGWKERVVVPLYMVLSFVCVEFCATEREAFSNQWLAVLISTMGIYFFSKCCVRR